MSGNFFGGAVRSTCCSAAARADADGDEPAATSVRPPAVHSVMMLAASRCRRCRAALRRDRRARRDRRRPFNGRRARRVAVAALSVLGVAFPVARVVQVLAVSPRRPCWRPRDPRARASARCSLASSVVAACVRVDGAGRGTSAAPEAASGTSCCRRWRPPSLRRVARGYATGTLGDRRLARFPAVFGALPKAAALLVLCGPFLVAYGCSRSG